MTKKQNTSTPFFLQDPAQRKPLFDMSADITKTKRKPLNDYFDEDMQFIIDTYQEGFKNVVTPHSENKMRDRILRKICRKKAPGKEKLLDAVDRIVNDVQKERKTLADGLEELRAFAHRFGDPKLISGIDQKIAQIQSEAQHQVKQWLSFFSQPVQFNFNPRPTLPKLVSASKKREQAIARFVAPPRKSKRAAPHPLAQFLQEPNKKTHSSKKRAKKQVSRQPLQPLPLQPLRLRPLLPPDQQKKTKKRRRR